MLLRIPKELREALAVAARHNRRSTTAEILFRLEESIRADERRQMKD